MPRKNPNSTPEDTLPEGEKQPRGKQLPHIRIPVTAEGNLDMDRVKDPAMLERARIALGMPEGSIPAAAEEVQKVPREFIPMLYDGLALGIQQVIKLAKWPRVMNEEQRALFRSQLWYSEKFKAEATEPTGRCLDKALGNSKLTAWLLKNSDWAMLVKIIGEGTMEMIQNAGAPFVQAAMGAHEKEEAKKRANGGFPASENRPVPTPGTSYQKPDGSYDVAPHPVEVAQ